MLSKSFAVVLSLLASLTSAVPTRMMVSAPVKRDNNGQGTIYQQLGAYGSCGDQHGDGDMIAALGMDWMQHQYKSPYCGRRLRIRNTGSNDGVGGQGNTIEVAVADSCGACDRNHVDLSVGAWDALTNGAAWGTVNIEWDFI